MKTSKEFIGEQLERARRIISKRKLLTRADLGKVLTLMVQGNGNMLKVRPAMIYNLNATTIERATVAKQLLKTDAFYAKCKDLDEDQIKAWVNDILNNSQVSFTVPLTGSQSGHFETGSMVSALIEEYTVAARSESADANGVVIPARPAYTSIGANNVRPVQASAASSAQSFFGDFDNEDYTEGGAVLEDSVLEGAQGYIGTQQADAFDDAHVGPNGSTATA